MMLADESVMCRGSRERVEEILGRWGYAVERGGERMCAHEREMQGVEVVMEDEYRGSTMKSYSAQESEGSAGWVEQVETSVRGDLWQMHRSKSQREGLQGANETCSDVRFGDGGSHKNTGQAGGDRVEDAQIFDGVTRMDRNEYIRLTTQATGQRMCI